MLQSNSSIEADEFGCLRSWPRCDVAVSAGGHPLAGPMNSILVVAPVVIIFFLAQRRLIEGITLTAVKG